ncbi:MAG: Rrf2 family transcriptional regulator [Chloroflexi bacterium]|nr:Rrf2 family transcriptional regulator [Chloroflexota bacterium]
MKLSTRSRYGLRAMLVLAMHESDEPMMTKEIAEKQNLPATYLEQLMLTLRKAGLVLATRGAKGGYVLARDPRTISLAQVVEALEGPLDIADCADVPNCCQDPSACALKEVFTEANKALYDVFDHMSLAELAENQRAKQVSRTEMYYI